LEKIAPSYRKKILFAFHNKEGKRATAISEYYALENIPGSIAIIYSNKLGKLYLLEEPELTEDNLRKFADEFLHGVLKSYQRKESTDDNNDSIVKKVVYDNYDQLVRMADKDVVVFFYIPKCKGCDQFLSTYEDVANEISKNADDRIAFYKMDLYRNEQPHPLSIRNFPSVAVFPKNEKNVHKLFTAKRTKANLLDFIKEHATFTFSGTPVEQLDALNAAQQQIV